jgi:PadR family transcriptional regulator, regulatory protein PadR
MARGPNPNFMAGVPELVILNLLREREMYGYQIVQAIHLNSAGALILAEGVVYPVLHDLKQEGALKARRQTVDGRSRVYYTLTTKGEKRLKDLTKDWAGLTATIQGMLGGGHAKAV